jgi:hypothetical protein
VAVLPYAIGQEESTVYFNFHEGGESGVKRDGQNAIRCVTLDKELKGKDPTFIKMDIEGYEAFALQGAREIIGKARPVLAICVYHMPLDILNLPLMIKNIVPDYHFIIRAYMPTFEYVCYAIPPERLKQR